MQGRIYIKDGDRFLMQFAEGQAGVAGMTTLVTPDGRWLYKYEAGAPLAMRWDLNYIQERTGLLGPRVQYDVTGGALLQVLRRRPDVVLENDQERESYPCRVLSYASSSLRVPTPTVPPGYPGGGVVRTRLYFRRSDGLLVAEQELGADGRVLSSYEVFEVAPVAAWPEGLFDLPDGLSFLDLTRQLTRRLLLADPLTPLGGGVPSRGGGAPPAGL